MSSTQSFSLTLSKSNASTYLAADGANIGGSYIASVSLFGHGYANLNATAKNTLYPNATAHPTKADSLMTHAGLGVDRLQFGGNNVASVSDSKTKTETDLTSNAITSSTKATVIRYEIDASGAIIGCRLTAATITLYFTRYDFSASADTGVTSATVSSSTGYDGDTVTFSCVIPTGYVFDGWYNGNTLVSSSQSYTHTVSGADLSLMAKAHQNTHNVNGTYSGSTKAILTGISGDVAVGYNGKTKTLNASSASHTLSCANKVMRGNVSVGSASLATGGKVMRSDLVLNYV